MKKLIPLFLLFLVIGFLLVGCGTTNSGAYTDYYYPDWTPDGKIICIKKVSNWQETGGFRAVTSRQYYIVTMSDEGTQEAIIKQINGVGQVAMSPLGNYIAYAEGKYIKTITSIGSIIAEINCDVQDLDFDWDSAGGKLIYNIYRYSSGESLCELGVVDVDGGNKKAVLSSTSSPSWRFGNRIIIDRDISTEPSIGSYETIVLDGANFAEVGQYPKVVGTEYNISKVNTNEVIFRGEGIKMFYLDSPTTEPILLNAVTTVFDIHLSPNGKKIVGTGDTYGDELGSQIWIMNIDGSGLTRLK